METVFFFIMVIIGFIGASIFHNKYNLLMSCNMMIFVSMFAAIISSFVVGLDHNLIEPLLGAIITLGMMGLIQAIARL